MESGKADNPLNLALSMPLGEREKTIDLNVGYSEQTKQWELIVKYHGNLENLAERIGVSAIPLLNSYAIITAEETRIPLLLRQEEIEFAEKPNRLFFELKDSTAASCLPAGRGQYGALNGAGVLVGIVDSGIDYTHPDFRNPDGTTRIYRLWDQTIPDGVFSEEQINRALEATTPEERYSIVPSRDISGHGTAVTGIAAGNGAASGGVYQGVAYESKLMVVKLGSSVGDSFPRTTNLMTAVDFLAREAFNAGMPLAINISFGNNYGAHDGTSLLERYLDEMTDFWKMSIVVGTGNEGAARGHFSGTLGKEEQTVELSVGSAERSLSLQIWKEYSDRFQIVVVSPAGEETVLSDMVSGSGRVVRARLEDTEVLAYLGEPKPYSVNQEIYLELIPVGERMNSGNWRIRLVPVSIVSGKYDLWLPGSEALEAGTGFLRPSELTTLTIPSTASRVISVGAYDSHNDSYAFFSGRGYTVGTKNSKPDLVAPGVNIYTTAVGGGYALRTGTSMAAPFVSGAAALLLQWGLVQEYDPYLYGEKIKAYLRRGARKLPGFAEFPNQQIGWGALCVRDSLTTSQTVSV